MKSQSTIAVVGMAGLFPGANDLDTFWGNLIAGTEAVADVPAGRWIVPPEAMFDPKPRPDKAFSKRAGLIRDFVFEPDGLDLDPDLVCELDPMYRIVLHTGRAAWFSCRHAQVDRERVGTILAAIALPTDTASAVARKAVGTAFAEKILGKAAPSLAPAPTRYQALASRVTGFPATLLASALGLSGGSYTLDAACASSLYTVKLACDELLAHRADVMLAGGVSRPECLYTQVGFSQLRALSPSGRCAPFDASADGLVVGEGAGILVLKRLEDALAHGDELLGVIRGIGLANDLDGNLLSPDSEGQLRAMRKAYAAAGWRPQDIDLIECHGAGTPRGDAVELASLSALWGRSGWQPAQCAIGSVKSMIGHLLTAAGAAGLIKTLLALKHAVLPPSLNFSKPAPQSPLPGSPFRVQTTAQKWPARTPGSPRRAAVSAFGFGGINAHLLLEEYRGETDGRAKAAISLRTDAELSGTGHSARSGRKPVPALPAEPIAVIGMDAAAGSLKSLREFQEAILKGDSVFARRPPQRFKGAEPTAEAGLAGRAAWGAFIEDFQIGIGEFHIPPGELPDIIPQHLLMLKIAAGAMRNAGLPLREDRPDMSVLVGMGFDFLATDFHLRWSLSNAVGPWAEKLGLDLDAAGKARWLEALRDACGPPLTSSRTLGALGGIIASRIAREFRLGGPSFVVSAEEASGLRALEIGMRALQRGEIEAALVGAVDFTGDVRALLTAAALRRYSRADRVRPFDRSADGTLAADGAVGLVLKRLDRALEDHDRIYAVLKGCGAAGNGPIACERSLQRAFDDAGLAPQSIGYLEAHGSGDPAEDRLEAEALHKFFPARATADACAVGSLKASIGHVGAAAGLFAVAKTCLCLYQQILPPLAGFSVPASPLWADGRFHFPVKPQFWWRNRGDGPRQAVAGALTSEGHWAHVVLEEAPESAADAGRAAELVCAERKAPLGFNDTGLFVVTGNSRRELSEEFGRLAGHARRSRQDSGPLEAIARSWFRQAPPAADAALAASVVCSDISRLEELIDAARAVVAENATPPAGTAGGAVRFAPEPLGPAAQTAFIFPGSGNHYPAMGREIGVRRPEILRGMDAETLELKAQMRPHCHMPWRTGWEPGWELATEERIAADPLNPIFGQVVHGDLMTRLVRGFGIRPAAAIGYSLGESTGLFAMGAWPERGTMLKRMAATDLFSAQLAGACLAARKAWKIDPAETFHWRAAVVNRPVDAVRAAVADRPYVRLLIVNSPAECVIGGRREELEATVRALGCEAVYLNGVVTVHCDALGPVADAYRSLHLLAATPPAGIRFYSCALGRTYPVGRESAADAILKQALEGFDFTAVIRRAYEDGIRVFLEMGPHASCTRMIHNILKGERHLAASACVRGENDYLTLLKLLAALAAERIPLDLAPLYGTKTYPPQLEERAQAEVSAAPASFFTVQVGGPAPIPPPLPTASRAVRTAAATAPAQPAAASPGSSSPPSPCAEFIERHEKNMAATAAAHSRFLDFSSRLQHEMAETYRLQTQVLEKMIARGIDPPAAPGFERDQSATAAVPENSDPMDRTDQSTAAAPLPAAPTELDSKEETSIQAAFSRADCMEFAVGSVARVLGPEFAVVDTHKVRVRLPDEPLMLVDRILSVAGEKGKLGPGRIVTEHTVVPQAWYLDGGRAPVCISVEAGQADLFLCAYLGIDLAVKGERAYRLLDATVTFHRCLPRPGELIRYDIRIEKFVRQGETYLFFFNFEGFIGSERLITMTNGCAGFFTPAEVRNSGGILAGDEPEQPQSAKNTAPVPIAPGLVPQDIESYDDEALAALRRGEPGACFGPAFDSIAVAEGLRLPGGRMKLIDRVLALDPRGGRFGLGAIRAEADIHPDDWYLACHFVDDPVMPGTLMYECCAHTLRVFLQRLGWLSDKPGTCYEPVPGVASVLKCRGPVTPATRKVVYEVEIKKFGDAPEPYVIADAHMYADGRYIVRFTDMSLKLSGTDRSGLESFWQTRAETARFDRAHILEFATGKASLAFGAPYRPFDKDRFIARLPAPPYSFIDRISRVEPPPWELKPDGWIEAEYRVFPDAWYFRADRSGQMPFCILLEIALQPCGWLAAYAGSALRSAKDLKFRNLGGEAVLHRPVRPEAGRLSTRARLTQVSEAGEMIIEHFRFEVRQGASLVYDGTSYFGFFTPAALAEQVGIRDPGELQFTPDPAAIAGARPDILASEAPLTPDDPRLDPAPALALPAAALRMIDRVDLFLPDGGPQACGFIRGSKSVDPDEWFFKAHFHQDPVCPGSLGIESFLQLIKYAARKRWRRLTDTHRFVPLLDRTHRWTYRGQIVPQNKKIVVEALVTAGSKTPCPQMTANGLLKVDGVCIYRMEDFGFELKPADK